jgi:Uncharacterized protein conserved in bacteria
MKRFQKLYDENKKLDVMFNDLYNIYSDDIIEKNIIELLVELGELANESRSFKYWTKKPPSDKTIILEEYTDGLLMILAFFNVKEIDLDETFPIIEEKNIIAAFKELFNLVSELDYNLDNNMLKLIFSNMINLGYLLSFTDNDIIDGSINKINKNKIRFEGGF